MELLIIGALTVAFIAAILHSIKDISEIKQEISQIKKQNEELKELIKNKDNLNV